MKKIVLFIVTLFSFVACDLTTLEPAQTKAFMKFYGDVGNTEGADLLKLDDGYLLLGNNAPTADSSIAVLIKVDLKGNQLWANSFPGIEASALAMSADGYYIVGDRINSDPQNTRMSLIKTDLAGGTQLAATFLGETNIAYHGTAILISSIGEIIVTGYTENNATSTDQAFIYGYDTNLTPTWTAVRKWGQADVSLTTSKTLLEDNGNFVWTNMTIANSIKEIRAISVSRDQTAVIDAQQLLSGRMITGNIGDISTTNTGGGVIVQTVDDESNSIALASYNNGFELSASLISEPDSNLSAQAVIRSNGGDYVVLGSIDVNGRVDTDFYLTKVGFDGSVSSSTGFTNIIGGTGNETGAAIVEADDGGFVFLGTMENTNEFKLMVLVKVNNKGELIN